MSEEREIQSIKELIESTYNDWKSDANFIKDIRTKNESEFSALLHHGFGQSIRNKYLWKQNTKIYEECVALGLEHPDDMSGYIIIKLYEYAKKESKYDSGVTPKDEYETVAETKTEIEQAESKNINFLDWLEIQREYPLSIEKLKDWFKSRYMFDDSPFAGMEVVVQQATIILTDGQGGAYLNTRDLYDFFDSLELRPFVMPVQDASINTYPACKYIIQSKKSVKEFEETFNSRAEAEIAMFIKTFFYSEVTLAYQKNKEEKTDKK